MCNFHTNLGIVIQFGVLNINTYKWRWWNLLAYSWWEHVVSKSLEKYKVNLGVIFRVICWSLVCISFAQFLYLLLQHAWVVYNQALLVSDTSIEVIKSASRYEDRNENEQKNSQYLPHFIKMALAPNLWIGPCP